jgi:hypothetical protein
VRNMVSHNSLKPVKKNLVLIIITLNLEIRLIYFILSISDTYVDGHICTGFIST